MEPNSIRAKFTGVRTVYTASECEREYARERNMIQVNSGEYRTVAITEGVGEEVEHEWMGRKVN